MALTDDTALRASGGRFTQLPSLPLQLPGAQDFGLRLLGLQSSWKGSLGIETKHFGAIDLSITGFVQSLVLTELRNPTTTNPDPWPTISWPGATRSPMAWRCWPGQLVQKSYQIVLPSIGVRAEF
jgi:hypothetical protein